MNPFIIIFFLLLASCASFRIRTPDEVKYDRNKEHQHELADQYTGKAIDLLKKLREDAKKEPLVDSELDDIVDILEKGLVVDDSKLVDIDKLKDVKKEELPEAIKDIEKDGLYIRRENDKLSDKIENSNNDDKVDRIANDALKADQIKRNIKFYTILGLILAIIGGLIYLNPTKALGIFTGFFK